MSEEFKIHEYCIEVGSKSLGNRSPVRALVTSVKIDEGKLNAYNKNTLVFSLSEWDYMIEAMLPAHE